jgi:hypothetical protein
LIDRSLGWLEKRPIATGRLGRRLDEAGGAATVAKLGGGVRRGPVDAHSLSTLEARRDSACAAMSVEGDFRELSSDMNDQTAKHAACHCSRPVQLDEGLYRALGQRRYRDHQSD